MQQYSSPSRISIIGWTVTILAAIGAFIFIAMLRGKHHEQPREQLPVLAQVPPFAFTSDSGNKVTRDTLAGKIWVADFIFTRCPGPCPAMSLRMSQLQRLLVSSPDDVRLVSVTVDPEFDSPNELAKYGTKYGSDPARWMFLTGAPDDITRFVSKGMLLPLAKNADGAPMHSQRFVVVDRQGGIRAYRDLSDPNLLQELLADITTLRLEKPASGK